LIDPTDEMRERKLRQPLQKAAKERHSRALEKGLDDVKLQMISNDYSKIYNNLEMFACL